jgi:hypothetical protein
VIIDGDGIYTEAAIHVPEADRLGVPVFAIALGDTTVRSDLVLRGVEHNRIGYLGNELPLLFVSKRSTWVVRVRGSPYCTRARKSWARTS